MKYDPFFNQILSRLAGSLDADLFEVCAVELIRTDGFAVVPIRGGNDAGMDGAIADGNGEPYPLVTTTGKNCIGNLTSNLQQYINQGKKRRKVIFATSQALTPQKRRNLEARAVELGFELIQTYEQYGIAMRLYRNPVWCKELLGLSGVPSPLSVIPLTHRPLLNTNLIGREEALEWLKNTTGDRLLAGEPGSGKTSLLFHIARSQSAFFAVSKDMNDLANAIRELEPKIVFVDDAHVDPDFLLRLRWLRSEIRAEFDLIATCWTGDKDKSTIEDILNLSEAQIHTLKRLTRDQMVVVIADAGIKDPNWLVREIITQSEGLPGLGVTLTSLCLQGSVKHIHSADALRSNILNFYVNRVEGHVREILASFALGGDAGMLKSTVANELSISLPELRKILAELAAGGVIAEVGFEPDRLRVRPAPFRHALIRDVFFSGVTALPSSTLDKLLGESPNPIETTRDLISVKLRGGNVSDDLLREYLNLFPAIPDIWFIYAMLGNQEANWTLDHF